MSKRMYSYPEGKYPVSEAPIAEWPGWALELLDVGSAHSVREEGPRTEFGPASQYVLEAARKALQQHGPAIQGAGGDDHTFRAGAILRNDYALTEEEALPIAREWDRTNNQPPWGDDLLAKLGNGEKYASGPYGESRLWSRMCERLTPRYWLASVRSPSI